MSIHREAGVSGAKFILILFLVLLILSAGVFGVYMYTKQSRTDNASLFMSNLLGKIEDADTANTFQLVSASASNDPSSAYYSWVFWVTPFKENSISIDRSPTSVVYKNSSLLGLSANDTTIKYTYSTNKNTSIYVTIEHSNKGWLVKDYGTNT